MPRRLKSDAATLHARISRIVARELSLLRMRQLGAKRAGLDLDDARKLKLLSDMLNDTIKTRRTLEDDLKKALEKMGKDALEALAATAPKAELSANPKAPKGDA